MKRRYISYEESEILLKINAGWFRGKILDEFLLTDAELKSICRKLEVKVPPIRPERKDFITWREYRSIPKWLLRGWGLNRISKKIRTKVTVVRKAFHERKWDYAFKCTKCGKLNVVKYHGVYPCKRVCDECDKKRRYKSNVKYIVKRYKIDPVFKELHKKRRRDYWARVESARTKLKRQQLREAGDK